MHAVERDRLDTPSPSGVVVRVCDDRAVFIGLQLVTPNPAPSAANHVLGLAVETWTVIGVLGALVAVVVTTVMNLRSERLTRLGLESEQEQAEATAARAEAAARVTEGYTRRVVEALEAIATSGVGAPAPRRVTWELVHHGGDTYRLTNTGEATASSVTISADASLRLVDLPQPRSLRAGEAVTFMAAASMGTRDRTITVTWRDEAGDEHDWKYPLPPRPPRVR